MTNPEKYEILKKLYDAIYTAPISEETKIKMTELLYALEMKPIRQEWADSVLKKEAK